MRAAEIQTSSKTLTSRTILKDGDPSVSCKEIIHLSYDVNLYLNMRFEQRKRTADRIYKKINQHETSLSSVCLLYPNRGHQVLVLGVILPPLPAARAIPMALRHVSC